MATVRLNTVIERSSIGESYFIYDPESGQQGFAPDSPAWFTWLSQRTSFHFTGKHGHFTARQERKQRGETYWYGYRKVAGRQRKRYLGTTDKLTLAHLEEVSDALQEEALGIFGETEGRNTSAPKPAPEWLPLGSVSVQWDENVLRIRMPQERQTLSRSQTAQLLWYLYDHRREILKKTS
ncbi:MAG TPA: hypothetical protein VEL31_20970 [Ktedonobacteraceae bacterium]|nr:hypothetical protein [Ktedonobacteraceae bacterium]